MIDAVMEPIREEGLGEVLVVIDRLPGHNTRDSSSLIGCCVVLRMIKADFHRPFMFGVKKPTEPKIELRYAEVFIEDRSRVVPLRKDQTENKDFYRVLEVQKRIPLLGRRANSDSTDRASGLHRQISP